jgi:hypothetical protein
VAVSFQYFAVRDLADILPLAVGRQRGLGCLGCDARTARVGGSCADVAWRRVAVDPQSVTSALPCS